MTQPITPIIIGVDGDPIDPKDEPPVIDYAVVAAAAKPTVEESWKTPGKIDAIIYVIIEVDRSNGNNMPTMMDYDREAIITEAQARGAVVAAWPVVADFR